MKVAVISDIHGNMAALEAALDDISRQGVDQVICAGDIPNPFLRSRDAWLKIKELGIPIIRGNHEDYIASYFSGDRPEIRESIQFLPVQIVARHLGPEIAGEFARLPFDHVVRGPGGDDIYICHASPQHNARSYIRGVDEEMAQAFVPIAARTIVAGHIHHPWSGAWQGKNLVIGGSVGLPHHGEPEAQYALLSHIGGQWKADLRLVPYDQAAALKEYRESEAYAQGGPIALLLYEEILRCRALLAHFLPRVLADPATRPSSLEEWGRAAQSYLKSLPTGY